MKPFGAVGYISKGPVLASDNTEIQEFILDQLDRVAKEEHILFLKVQPPYGAEDLAERLLGRGALRSEMVVVSQATTRVDIRPEPDAILAGMHQKTRYNIRRSERKGVVVRRGTEADMPLFHRLVETHSEQQGYYPFARKYRQNVWSIFSPSDHSCLLLAEYEGEPLSATMVLAFGDVLFSIIIVDGGHRRDLNAQSLLHWKAMLWGKEKGCAWYDFGGISKSITSNMVNDEPFPETRAGGLARYKMSFGSQLILRPDAYDISYVWPRRLTGRMVPALMKAKTLLRFMIGGSIYGDYQ